MFDRVQVLALTGPLKDIQRLVPKPLLHCLGSVLRVVVLLEGEPSPYAATTMLHRRDGASFPPDVKLDIQTKELHFGFIRPENLVSHGLRVFRCLLANSKRAVMCLLLSSGFCLATLP